MCTYHMIRGQHIKKARKEADLVRVMRERERVRNARVRILENMGAGKTDRDKKRGRAEKASEHGRGVAQAQQHY